MYSLMTLNAIKEMKKTNLCVGDQKIPASFFVLH